MATTELCLTLALDDEGNLDDARCDAAVVYSDEGDANETEATVGGFLRPEGCFTVRVGGRLFHVTVQELTEA